MEKRKKYVYVIISETRFIYGCFDSKIKAEKFISSSSGYLSINKLEVV